MAISELATAYYPADPSNYSQGRNGYKICKITPHHMSGKLTAKQCASIFQRSSRNASSNYGIGYDGEIACYVKEENRAWTSSSPWNDNQAITIEVSNSENCYPWKISDASWNSLVNLCVDICKRHGFRLEYDGTKNGSLTRHNMYANTDCPGPYLQDKFPELAETVNAILDGQQPTPQPTPTPSEGYLVKVTVDALNIRQGPGTNSSIVGCIIDRGTYTIVETQSNWGKLKSGAGWICLNYAEKIGSVPAKKSNEEIAEEVIAGKWGNGEDRKNRLTAAGYDYSTIQNIVNRKVKGSSSISNKKSNDEIANEVIAGKWGNGQDRKNRLAAAGYDYSTIQRIVNQKLR